MDEKRFVVYNERTVEDTLTGKRYVCSWKSDAEDIVKLLNLIRCFLVFRSFLDYWLHILKILLLGIIL